MQAALATPDTSPAPALGSMTLDQWMKARELDDAAVGEMVGRDAITVYRVRTGRAKPSFDLIEKLIEVSDGLVDGNSFFKRALGKAAASRGVTPSGPFSSTSSPARGRPVPSHASGGGEPPKFRPPSSAPTPSPPRSSKRCRP